MFSIDLASFVYPILSAKLLIEYRRQNMVQSFNALILLSARFSYIKPRRLYTSANYVVQLFRKNPSVYEQSQQQVVKQILMLRSIGAVVAGIVAGSIMVALVESLGHAAFPLPEGLQADLNNPAAIKKLMDSVPLGSKVAVLVAWASGALVSGMVAMAISGKRTSARATGIFMLVAVILNLMMIPHPLWMMAGGILLPVPASLAGARLVQKKIPHNSGN